MEIDFLVRLWIILSLFAFFLMLFDGSFREVLLSLSIILALSLVLIKEDELSKIKVNTKNKMIKKRSRRF